MHGELANMHQTIKCLKFHKLPLTERCRKKKITVQMHQKPMQRNVLLNGHQYGKKCPKDIMVKYHIHIHTL